MSTAKHILLAAALSMLGSSAFAMEYTVSTSVSQAPTDFGNTDFGQAPVVLTIDGFDSAGHNNGILTGVALTLQGEGDLSMTVTNGSDDFVDTNVYVQLGILLRNAPGTNVDHLDDLSSYFLQSQDFSLGPNQSAFFGPYSVAETTSISLEDLPPFTASSLSFNLLANTIRYADSDAPQYSNITSTAGATLSVTYTYDEASAIPEPASMALLGAGLAGIHLLRRKRAPSTSSPL